MSESGESEKDKRRSVVQSLPSDYSDVQPKNYDPDFISDISNKMQVPDSLGGGYDGSSQSSRLSGQWEGRRSGSQMNVPERIMLAGGGQHIGAKPELRAFDFDSMPARGDYSQPVALLTPPRTLTVEEQFPQVEEADTFDEERTPRKIPNGTRITLPPEPYTPGMSASDSLLLNEEDETTQLKTQMGKLMRRVAVLEKDQRTQASREMYFYTATIGYFMLKFVFWFFRNK